MCPNRTLLRLALIVLAALPCWTADASAQTRVFVARLSIVPITVAMQETVAGVGSATAVLAGDRLTVEGTFQGLRSRATIARLHIGPRAIRGAAFADIPVPSGTSGSFKGVVQLSGAQREALDKRALYIQLYSEKAPDGNLWGWFFPQEEKR
jgi:hypothetical protein